MSEEASKAERKGGKEEKTERRKKEGGEAR